MPLANCELSAALHEYSGRCSARRENSMNSLCRSMRQPRQLLNSSKFRSRSVEPAKNEPVSAVGGAKEAAASAALRILRHEPKEGILFRFRHRY